MTHDVYDITRERLMEAEFTEKQARELVDMTERLNTKEERIKELIDNATDKLYVRLMLSIGAMLAFLAALDKLF